MGSATHRTSESALTRYQNTGRFSARVRLARHCRQRLSRHATATKNHAARQVEASGAVLLPDAPELPVAHAGDLFPVPPGTGGL